MMKKKIYSLLAVILSLCGCENSDIMQYEQHPMIYFTDNSFTYSFLEDPNDNTHTIKIPCDISGLLADYDREIAVQVSPIDSLTTATPDQYRIGECVVKANKYIGYVEVEVFRDERLADSIYQVALEIVPNENFPEVRLNQKTLILSFTDKVVKPANWKWLRWYFTPGDKEYFSTAWWKFICSVTGRTSLPYYPDQDPEIWWMSIDMVAAYATQVHQALIKYNADPTNPNRPLKHDDGPYAGQVIEWTWSY